MTFAGSPDRVESRLVPEAGFELDTFAISGFPRSPSIALLRSLWQAGKAPFACRAILQRRRPDVVLGGGGYVAGPMVLAARWSGIPAALTEADAHLGLANRLAAPFASKLYLAYDIPGRNGAKVEVVGRPIPIAHLGSTRAEARARLGLDATAPTVAVFGALAGAASLNEMAVNAWGMQGPAVVHVSGDRDFAALRPRVRRLRLPVAAPDRVVRRRPRRSGHCRLPSRWDGVGAGRRRDPVDPRAVPACDRRPPDAQRASFRARRWCTRRPECRRSRSFLRSWTSFSPTLDGSQQWERQCGRWRGWTRRTGSPKG